MDESEEDIRQRRRRRRARASLEPEEDATEPAKKRPRIAKAGASERDSALADPKKKSADKKSANKKSAEKKSALADTTTKKLLPKTTRKVAKSRQRSDEASHSESHTSGSDAPTPVKRPKGRPRTEAKDRIPAPEFNSLWVRSIDRLGVNILKAIPHDMEVDAIGSGLDHPWSGSFVRNMRLCVVCPVFKGNLLLFRHALRCAIAIRVKSEPPEIPNELQGVQLPQQESDDEVSDVKEEPRTIDKKLIADIAEKQINSLKDVEEDANAENLLPRDRRPLRLKALESVLTEFLLEPRTRTPQANSPPGLITDFLKPAYFPKLPRYVQRDNCLLATDLTSIVAAWDKYAEETNRPSCQKMFDQVKHMNNRETLRVKQEISDFVATLPKSRVRKTAQSSPRREVSKKKTPPPPAHELSGEEASEVPQEQNPEDLNPDELCVKCGINLHGLSPQLRAPHDKQTCSATSPVNSDVTNHDTPLPEYGMPGKSSFTPTNKKVLGIDFSSTSGRVRISKQNSVDFLHLQESQYDNTSNTYEETNINLPLPTSRNSYGDSAPAGILSIDEDVDRVQRGTHAFRR